MAGWPVRLAGALVLAAALPCAFSQLLAQRSLVRISAPVSGAAVDESRMVTLSGNVHPLAQAVNEQGSVPDGTRLRGMMLELAPTAAQEASLDALLAAQQNPASSSYRKWLTSAEFGARFGVSDAALAQVRSWLLSRGFTVDEVAASKRVIVFSGTAAQVQEAFHTSLRRYSVNGVTHIANAQDPEIPAALAGSVAGVVSLHDFRSRSTIASRTQIGARAKASSVKPYYSAGSTHYLFPADFATIYNLAPLTSAGLSGAGQTIAIAGRSNINLSDVASFRAQAGLAANAPKVVLPSTDPGLGSEDQDEATLDVEWAGAAAPKAAVTLVAAPSTTTSDGIAIAASYIVNHALGSVISVSYANCESAMGSAELSFYNALWKQAAAQGQTVLVSSGDSGAAGCQTASATKGTSLAVNGICSSPYATCVGGTQFDEGSSTASYWASSNTSSYGSALSYIPEKVWNESAAQDGTGLWASGGGRSTIYTQPAWQSAVEGASAANGMRAVPDIALSSAAHDGAMIVENATPFVVSGTSVAAPALAGILALAAQKTGSGLGQANPRLYALAEASIGAFHRTLAGDNTVPGVAGFTASGAVYNLATGLGSVDASVLVTNWKSTSSNIAPTLTLSVAPTEITLVQGASADVSVTVQTGGGFSGSVTLSQAGSILGAQWSERAFTPPEGNNTAQITLRLTASPRAMQGTYTVTVTASGSGLTASQALTVQVQKAQSCVRRFGPVRSLCRLPVPVSLRTLQDAR